MSDLGVKKRPYRPYSHCKLKNKACDFGKSGRIVVEYCMDSWGEGCVPAISMQYGASAM